MKSLLTVLMVLFLGQAASAWATCRAGVANINFGSQNIDATAPVGTEFGSTVATVNYNCDSPVLSTPDGRQSNDVVFQIKPTGMDTKLDYVYPTGVDGVGVRLRERSTGLFLVKPGRVRDTTAVNSFCWRQMASGYDDEGCGKLPPDQCRLGPNGGQCRISFQATLVKLGPVQGGSLNSAYADIQYYAPGTSGGSTLARMRISGTVAGRASCTIRDMNVDLGRVSVTTLSSDGNSAPRHFNVSLTGCEPNQQVALVLSTFTPAGASCDGVIANAATGTATGVGVRVARDGGAAVCWNSDVLYTVGPDGIIKVPMQATIKRLATTPGAGTVVGSMVVQATYR